MITKTINECICSGYRVINGELVDFKHVERGVKLNCAKASKMLRKMYKDESIVVVSVEVIQRHYEMSEEDFIAYGTEIEL